MVYVFVIGVFPAPKARFQGLKWRNAARTQLCYQFEIPPTGRGFVGGGGGEWGSPLPEIPGNLYMLYFSHGRSISEPILGYNINTKLCIEYRAYSQTDYHLYILNKNKFIDKFCHS